MASILYTPEVLNGEQRQADEITKYGVNFKKGELTEVDDHLSLKFLNSPLFSLEKVVISAEKPDKAINQGKSKSMTVKEIKGQLKAFKVDIPNNAKKTELKALLDKHMTKNGAD